MEINFHGQSCFSIKGKNGTVVTDPYDKSVGLTPPRNLKGTIVTISHNETGYNNAEGVQGEPKIIDWPGEYEVSGISVLGIPSFQYPLSEEEQKKHKKGEGENIIYCIDVDGFRVCHLGNVGHRLTSEIVEKMGDVDILLLPVGGEGMVDAAKAHEIIEQVEPKVVIPMHYAMPGLKKKLAPLADFLKEEGIKDPKKETSLKYTAKAQLPVDKMDVIVMEV